MTIRTGELLLKLRDLAELPAGNKLPTIRMLSASWGVSTRTIQAIVQEGVRQGWLETRPGSGVWPKGGASKSIVAIPRMDAVRMAEKLRSEIQTGRYASGQPLPSPKDLANLDEVHPATVRKAYGILVSQGIVARQGRSWITNLPQIRTASRSPVLLCIGAAGKDGYLRMESDREWDFWREIQQEAIRCGLEPRLVPIGDRLPDFDGPVFGAVVSNWHMSESGPLLDKLQRQKIPTAFWVVNEEVLPGVRYQHSRGLWFHDLAYGRSAGRTMAEFVHRTGSRKIAWVSPFHASTWSRNRLEGLKSRLDSGVEVLEATHDWVSEWDMQVQLAWNPEVTNRVDLEGVDPFVEPDGLRRPLVETLTRMRCMEIFSPRLDDALRSGAKLWVAASDLVAEWCLFWLRSRGLRVPEDVAIASFDDTRDATRQNLTSLRFDVTGMARSMVRQVLSSREDHRRVTRYTGHVMERASTLLRRDAGGI